MKIKLSQLRTLIKEQLLIEQTKKDHKYTILIHGNRNTRETTGTLEELIKYFSYTLKVGKSYEREKGNRKINENPKNIKSLVDNLNNAKSNAAANGSSDTYYELKDEKLNL
jgi:hypothetical protein